MTSFLFFIQISASDQLSQAQSLILIASLVSPEVKENLRMMLGNKKAQPKIDASLVGLQSQGCFYFCLNKNLGKKMTAYSGECKGVGGGSCSNICHSIACQDYLADLSDWAGVPSLPQCSMCIPLEASHSVEEDTHPRQRGDGKLGRLNPSFSFHQIRTLTWDPLTS